MKNQNTNFPKPTREQIETAQGKHGEMTLIEAVLPLIVTIEGNDFFFFYEADNPKKCFAVECPNGTFAAWQDRMNSKPVPTSK